MTTAVETMEEQQPTEQEQQDISGKTLFVLVLLTLAVSFVGAWVSVASVTQLESGVVPGSPADAPAAGHVSFAIEGRDAETTAGNVAFEIVEPSETG